MTNPHDMPEDEAARESLQREAVLRDCIEAIYKVFSKYKLASHIEPDPYFPGFSDDRPLRSAPLRQLPATAFEYYQTKAISTWGRLHDFKHFLPRLIELVSFPLPRTWEYILSPVEIDYVFGKLQYGQWRLWSSAEQQALEAYFNALWLALLARPVDTSEDMLAIASLSDSIYAFSHVFEDISHFLERWYVEASDPATGFSAAGQLAKTIVFHRDEIVNDNNLGWSEYSEFVAQEKQLVTLLTSQEVHKLMGTVFFRWPDSSYAALFSQAQDCLDAWKKNRSAQP